MALKSTVLSGINPDTVYQSNGESAAATTYFCNRSVGIVNVNIHLVSSGELATPDNIIYNSLQIAPNDTYVMDTERVIFSDGDAIVAQATMPDAIVATVSYVGV